MKDKNILYAVGQALAVPPITGGQTDSWMLEGLFLTEEEAVANCIKDDFFVVPVPVGQLTGSEIPDGLFWPRLQSKAEGQARIDAYRESLEWDVEKEHK